MSHLEHLPTDDESVGINVIARMQQHIGPLPPPNMLREYGEVVPGLERIIVDEFQNEAESRRQENKTILKIEKRGQWFGFSVAIGGFALSGFMTHLGYPTQAATVSGITLVGIVTAFIKGRNSNEK